MSGYKDTFSVKLKWGKILSDPAFWVLLGVNIWLVYSYEQTPEIFTTLIWLYWSQSVLYGIFNYIYVRNALKGTPDITKQSVTNISKGQYAEASNWVFVRMYAIFHLVYIVFLATMEKTGSFQWDFFWKYLIVFAVFQVISFVQLRVQNKDKNVDYSKMTTLPFIRVVPMHLCILIPAFLSISHLTIFLVLKVICDVVMYVHTTNYYKTNPIGTMTSANINSTLSS